MPRLALCFAVMLPLVAVAPARAEVLPSDVALVEDTDGAIIDGALPYMARASGRSARWPRPRSPVTART